MGLIDRIVKFFRPQQVQPDKRAGVGGTNAVGGFLVSTERSPDLSYGPTRFKTLNEMVLNTAVVAAGVRYYLQMISGIGWTVAPPPEGGSEADEYADLVDDIINDMEIPWYRVVRGAALFKMLGFSVQERVAKMREDGVVGYESIERRPQFTIEQWDLDEAGRVVGFGQRVPYSGQLLYVPRHKCVYIVDDSLTDSPDGVGLLRQAVDANRQLKRFEQLEGWGYEADARGIPVGRAPIGLLDAQVANGVITQTAADKKLAGLKTIIKNHIKNPGLGLFIDSAVYTDQGPNLSPSGTPLYSIELMRGDGAGLGEINTAITRKNEEIARVLGVEHLLLGSNGKGSLALSTNKTDAFAQLLTSTLQELADSFKRDIVMPLFELNGWPKKLMPDLLPDAVQLSSVTEIMDALLKMFQAGAYLPPDDPVWNQVRMMLHLEEQPQMHPELAGVLGGSPAVNPGEGGGPKKPPGGKKSGPNSGAPKTGEQSALEAAGEVDDADELDDQDDQDEVDETDGSGGAPGSSPRRLAARAIPLAVNKTIRKRGGRFVLYSMDGAHSIGSYATRAEAEAAELNTRRRGGPRRRKAS